MSAPIPAFYAWCDEPTRVDAYAAALSTLVTTDYPLEIWIDSNTRCDTCSLEEAIAMLRTNFDTDTRAYISSSVTLSSGRVMAFRSRCDGDGLQHRGGAEPLFLSPYYEGTLIPERLEIARCGGSYPVEVEAAIAYLRTQPDVEDLLRRLCAPSAVSRVSTGGCTAHGHWAAPVELSATYHADATELARDLALSWLHLHDGDDVRRASGLSLSALHSRVEAAPRGTRVPVKGGGELSRELVLAALATPPAMLLDALEAAALPDDEWLAVEPRALEAVEATGQGANTYEAAVGSGKHVRFLRRHAPYHVRPLQSGGVILATYPFRSLWQLWTDALFMLELA